RKLATEFDALRDRAKNAYQHGRAAAASAFEAGEREAVVRHGEAVRPIDKAAKVLEGMQARLDAVHQDYKKFGLAEPPTTPTRERFEPDDPSGELLDRLARAEPDLALLEALYLPRMLKGRREIWVYIVVALMVAGLALWLFRDPTIVGVAAVLG